MTSKRVGILMGGLSAERAVSLSTGAAIADALAARGHAVTTIEVDRDVDVILRGRHRRGFLALHGTYGEDGCVQGLLELRGFVYGVVGMANRAAMDKVQSKQMFRLYDVPTAPFYVVREAHLGRSTRCNGRSVPVFVKPRANGSSVARQGRDLASLLRAAKLRGPREVALVERFVAGRELTVAVLDGKALGASRSHRRAASTTTRTSTSRGAASITTPRG